MARRRYVPQTSIGGTPLRPPGKPCLYALHFHPCGPSPHAGGGSPPKAAGRGRARTHSIAGTPPPEALFSQRGAGPGACRNGAAAGKGGNQSCACAPESHTSGSVSGSPVMGVSRGGRRLRAASAPFALARPRRRRSPLARLWLLSARAESNTAPCYDPTFSQNLYNL